MVLSPFTKQLFVALSPLLAALSVGGAVSFPTVLLHQLKAKDSLIHLDFDTASWIGAIHGLAGLPSILMPSIMQWKGRKFAFIAACLVSIIGWCIAYSAQTATAILISESFHGLGSNSIYAVTCLSITEMMAPENRDMFIQLYFIFLLVSMGFTGLMTQYLHWKTISIIMGLPMVLALIIACSWPESPYWLACKGEFEKCERAFVSLRGSDVTSMKELQDMISAQRANTPRSNKMSIRYICSTVIRREFYVPCVHIFVLEYLVHGIGLVIVLIYSIELLQQSIGNSSVAFFGSVIFTGIEVLGILASIALDRFVHFETKVRLLWGTVGAVVSLICASVVSYLQSVGYLSSESKLLLYCLMFYMTSLGMGIVPLAYPVASALMPVKHRGIGGILYVTNTCIMHTLALKLAPYLFLRLHLYGTFILLACNGIISGILIWKFIPETKGKTLQEIEDYYINGKYINSNDQNESNVGML